ncbi:MAG: DNA protecting protein DprA [Paenibacillus sp. RIFOXYA1_FULL_44_5]|nr:MAG: DNA protecting protein DprA [Paenibacillus sp. RIFOXYA1_FULL_44_5]
MEERDVLLMLHETKGIGWKTILYLKNELSDLRQIFQMGVQDWQHLSLPQKKFETIQKNLQNLFMEQQKMLYAKRKIGFITIFDAEYPELLKQTAEPPWVIYYRGNPDYLSRPKLSMVGTRYPSSYGKRAAVELSRELSRAGICVVSGLARGIDRAAHMGALEEEGGTIAVLGCAIDTIYPQENNELAERITEAGLIISEYPAGTPMHPGLFPQRNRIIAGLSYGTVVIEAQSKSGALITADQALEESRDVFALPGSIYAPNSQGTLQLIKQGAKMITSAEDILEEYAHLHLVKQTNPEQAKKGRAALSPEEERVYSCLSSDPLHIDRLVEQTGLSFGHLNGLLLSLLIKLQIEQLPGANYTVT